MSKTLRIIFMGSPDWALPALEALHQSSHRLLAVITQPDKAAGRGQKKTPCAVAERARELNLNLLQPNKIKDPDFLQSLQDFKADLIVVVAYGRILSKEILDLPTHGCWNLHFSLLPRYRGAAPVQWAIAKGETKTGVSLIKLVEELDAGPVLKQVAEQIHEDDSTKSLGMRLTQIGASLLKKALKELIDGNLMKTEQDHNDASLAPILKKEDGRIDWNISAKEINARMRAFNPWPGTYAIVDAPGSHVDKERLKIYIAQVIDLEANVSAGTIISKKAGEGLVVKCGKGAVKLLEVQLAGKKRMSAEDFTRGVALPEKARLL
jgi:methionyl-tRNA formyltransferase